MFLFPCVTDLAVVIDTVIEDFIVMAMQLYNAVLLNFTSTLFVNNVSENVLCCRRVKVFPVLSSRFACTRLPGIDFPSSRYSRTDGLRNPGGTVFCWPLGGPFRSSSSWSGMISLTDGALGLFAR